MTVRLHRSEFLRELKQTFPELRADLNREYGLLHFEVAAFCRHTQAAIDSGDRVAVSLAFKLAERYLLLGNARMQNAIVVSYVEDLDFKDSKTARSWAWEQLPLSLKAEYEKFHGKQTR
jgi:hypothetical protein